MLEARTFSPPQLDAATRDRPAAISPSSAYRRATCGAAAIFWEPLGFVALDEEAQPFARTATHQRPAQSGAVSHAGAAPAGADVRRSGHARATDALARTRLQAVRRNAGQLWTSDQRHSESAGRNPAAAADSPSVYVRSIATSDLPTAARTRTMTLRCFAGQPMHRFCLQHCSSALAAAVADEGMWTFDNFPQGGRQAEVRRRHRRRLARQRMQRSITRHESGCTGSFISPDGLVLTNHHCVMECLSEISSASDDYVENGFNATARSGERKCPTRDSLGADRKPRTSPPRSMPRPPAWRTPRPTRRASRR